jgi:sec-independent protein translocase protein TatC
MPFNKRSSNSEDMFADTRMSFGEHIEDLRRHLIRGLVGFMIALCVSFTFGNFVVAWIKAPIKDQLDAFYAERGRNAQQKLSEGNSRLERLNQPIKTSITIPKKELAEKLLSPKQAKEALEGGKEDETVKLSVEINNTLAVAQQLLPANQEIGPNAGLITLTITEAFMVWFKVCLMCGLVIGAPWIIYQIWSFVAAGLYPHEKRYVHVYLPFSIALFLAGVAMCELVVLPKAINALLWFNQWMGLDPQLRFSDWLNFAILLPLAVGVSFQLPLVMLFLERINVLTVQSYVGRWKYAFFVIQVIAAIIMPTPDPFSMELVALPLCGLYALGVALCWLRPRRRDLDIDVPSSEEMVEV